jgi:hypothetical protein
MEYVALPPTARLTIEPTGHFFMLGEVMVRAWTADDGTVALVAAVAVPQGDGVSPLASLGSLVEIPPPDEIAQLAWAERIIEGRESTNAARERVWKAYAAGLGNWTASEEAIRAAWHAGWTACEEELDNVEG